MSGNKKNDKDGFLQALALLTQISFTIIACITIALLIGFYLDRFLGTSPWMLLLFTVLGIFAALKSIYDFAKRH